MKRDNEHRDSIQEDPALKSLLDEALSPESVSGGVPEGLADRCYRASVGGLGRGDGVLARIGAPLRRIAAVIVAAATVGIVITGINIVQNARQNAIATNLTELEQGVHNLAMSEQEAAETVAAIDEEIVELSYTVESARRQASAADTWASIADALHAELDALEMNGNEG